jgi:hypothetical protein
MLFRVQEETKRRLRDNIAPAAKAKCRCPIQGLPETAINIASLVRMLFLLQAELLEKRFTILL